MTDKVEKTPTKQKISSQDAIRNNSRRLEQILAEKNHLRGLSRQDFIDAAVDIFDFAHKNGIITFVEGSGSEQQIFFAKLSASSGHMLDFSVVTDMHWDEICFAAKQHNSLIPMKQMLHDISDPERVRLLKEGLNYLQNHWKDDDVEDFSIRIANEGETYKGVYLDYSNKDRFIIIRQGEAIICDKEHLAPREFKELQSGDHLTFSVPRAKDLERVFIPKETLPPLLKEEITEMLRNDAFITQNKKEIQRLSQIVSGRAHALDEKMEQIIVDSNLGKQLIAQIEDSPQSIVKLAGIKASEVRNRMRGYSEENLTKLNTALTQYVNCICSYEVALTKNHEAEQKRCEQEVEMPSKELQRVLFMPKEMQSETLRTSSKLQKELRDFMNKIKDRLSSEEYRAIKTKDCTTLSESLGIPESRAKGIMDIVAKTQEAYQKVQELNVRHTQTTGMVR